MIEFIQWLMMGVAAIVALYVLVRVVSVAYFRTKSEYERRSRNHQE